MSRRAISFVSLALFLLTLTFPGPAQATPVASYSGQATALKVHVDGINATLVDTGPLPPTGGTITQSLLTATVGDPSNPVLTAGVLNAQTQGVGDTASSSASVASLTLNLLGHTITADVLKAESMAQCLPDGTAVVSGNSSIVNLTIDGNPITVGAAPNTTIDVGSSSTGDLLHLVINEQTSSVSGNHGEITVNALHVTALNGLVDVVVASAYSDITCVPEPGSLTLLGTGALGLLGYGVRRRNRTPPALA